MVALGDIADADYVPPPELVPPTDPGEPQTILILGSDERSNTPGDPGRSDTTMLLRVDPDGQVLSLLSLPRDLQVEIPGYGVGKLNEAYTEGGVFKTIRTVRNLTGVAINHVVNVDFQGFAEAVDAIDCVYVDVDRDYFNDNSTAAGSADEYAAIDVNAGYQRLCGLNALDYVRYRHTDSDFVRAARQQDFLRNARAQVPIEDVLPIIGGDTGGDLVKIFTDYTSTDFDGAGELVATLKALVGVRDVTLNQVKLEAADAVDGDAAYVVSTPAQIRKAVKEFLGENGAGDGGSSSGPAGDSEKTKPKPGKGGGKPDADVIPTADAQAGCAEGGGVDKVVAFGRTSARRLKFPVWLPTEVAPGSCYDAGSRQYEITDASDEKQDAYKMVIALNPSSPVVEYYGVEGTTWSDPPILADPSEVRTIGGREYELFYDGDRLRLVAFHDEEGNSYWVSNTLLRTLDDDQMLAIAASMDEAHA